MSLSNARAQSSKLKAVKAKSSNRFKEREILFYGHANNFHVVLDNKHRHFFIFRNHNGPFCPRKMINKMIPLGSNLSAPSRFK
jgi:hypothetical protein